MKTYQQEQQLFAEINDEDAANCSGGRVEFNGPDPDVILFEDVNYGGKRLGINATTGDGSSNLFSRIMSRIPPRTWNDKTSSIKVIRGEWQIFQNAGYNSPSRTLTRGDYRTPQAFGLPNDSLTSIRRTGA